VIHEIDFIHDLNLYRCKTSTVMLSYCFQFCHTINPLSGVSFNILPIQESFCRCLKDSVFEFRKGING